MPEPRDSSVPQEAAPSGTRGACARPWRLGTRLPALAGGAALALSGLLLAVSGTPGEGAMSNYRPGGLDLHRASRALSAHYPGSSLGCAALAGVGAGAAAPGRSEAPAGSIARVLDILARSATARAVLERTRGRGVHVCLDETTDLLAYYFSSVGVIGLSAELSQGGRIAFLAHELGHVPQHPRYSDNRYYPPEDLFLLRRIREAAAEAIATRIAWELRRAGHPEAWREKAAGPYGDVARAFAHAAESGPESGPEGDSGARALLAATRAAFDRWFAAGWRRDVYDRMTVDHLRRIAGDRMGLVPPSRRLRARFLTGIARLGGGNFLAETQGPALTDSYYAGRVSDRNAARLRRVLRDAELTASPIDETPMAGVAS